MAERYYWQDGRFYNASPAAKKNVDPMTADHTGEHLAELTGDEAHHLTRVMRQKPGDIVTLFDGHDREFRAEIVDSRKNGATLRILETRLVDTESPRQVTMAVSLPKGDRQKWLVEKLTELGCRCLIPLKTERNVAQASEQVLERLRRQVLEATKQCNRTRLMQIMPEMSIEKCTTEVAMFEDNSRHVEGDASNVDMAGFIAHPSSDGDFGQVALSELAQIVLPKRVLVLIGPEGGFTQNEVSRAVELGLKPLDLGPRILRVETAALMTTSVLTMLS